MNNSGPAGLDTKSIDTTGLQIFATPQTSPFIHTEPQKALLFSSLLPELACLSPVVLAFLSSVLRIVQDKAAYF